MTDFEFREKVKRLAIIALFSDDELLEKLVLKGGNLLDVVFGISARASLDVDLSTPGDFDLAELRERVSRALVTTFEEHDLVAFDVTVEEKPEGISNDLKGFWGGYDIFFKIIDRDGHEKFGQNLQDLRRNAANIGRHDSTKFNIQISKFEVCEPKDRHELDGYKIYVYSPQLLVCEKIRAICQQMPEYGEIVHNHGSARARDFVDIYTVAEHFKIAFDDNSLRATIKNVFAAKRVPLRLIGQIAETRDFHQGDFAAVQATVKANVKLKQFDFYFNWVVLKCRHLEPLWHK